MTLSDDAPRRPLQTIVGSVGWKVVGNRGTRLQIEYQLPNGDGLKSTLLGIDVHETPTSVTIDVRGQAVFYASQVGTFGDTVASYVELKEPLGTRELEHPKPVFPFDGEL